MGHTHYLSTEGMLDPVLWRKFLTVAAEVLTEAEQGLGIAIAGPDGAEGTRPFYAPDELSFNGVGKDSHESAVVLRTPSGFYFTKTNRKPYEAVVIAIFRLARATFPSAITWRWDAWLRPEHRAQAKHLLRTITGLNPVTAQGLREFVEKSPPMRLPADDPRDYPQLQKMHDSATEAQILRRFFAWLREQGLELCQMQDDARGTYWRDRRSEEELLADYFGIDLAEAERERERILEELVAAHEKKEES